MATMTSTGSRATHASHQGYRHLVWWTLVGVYFFLAICLIVGRWLFCTQMNVHQDDILDYLSERTGIQIQAKQIKGGFDRFWPTITLEDLTLSNEDRTGTLELPKVYARLSWSSLWHLEPRFNLLQIIQPKLAIERIGENQYAIAGMRFNTSGNSQGWLSTLGRLALKLEGQRKLEILNGEISYRDTFNPNNASISLRHVQFQFVQHLLNWQFALEAQNHTGSIETLRIIGKLQKSIIPSSSAPLNMGGELYISSSNIDIAKFLNQLDIATPLLSGQGQLAAWLTFKNNTLVHALSDINLQNVNVQFSPQQSPLGMQRLSSRLIFNDEETNSGKSTTLEAIDLQLTENEKSKREVWIPQLSVSRLQTPLHAQYLLKGEQLDLGFWRQYVLHLPIPEEIQTALSQHRFSGRLTNFSFNVQDNPLDIQNWSIHTEFDHLSYQSNEPLWPSFSNLTGSITGEQGQAIQIILNSSKAQARFPGLFLQPTMFFDQLNLKAKLQVLGNYPSVELTHFSIANPDAALEGKGAWKADDDYGTLWLKGKILRAHGPAVVNYLPTSIGNTTLSWLKKALLKGEVTEGSFDVQGPLIDFPWSQPSSENHHFIIQGRIRDGQLNFMPGHSKDNVDSSSATWPLLSDIEATLRFEGNGMSIQGTQVLSHGLKSQNASVSIPDFSHPILAVDGDISGDLSRVIQYLNDTPFLSNVTSNLFKESKGLGKTLTSLHLEIPLDNPEKAKVQIATTLEDNQFTFAPQWPVVRGLHGQLNVTERGFSIPTPLMGQLHQSAFELTQTTQGPRTTLHIQTQLGSDELVKWGRLSALSESLPSKIQGSTPLSVDVTWSSHAPGFSVNGKTNLKGLALYFPDPFSKAEPEAWETQFSFDYLNRNQASLSIKMASRLNAKLAFNPSLDPQSFSGTIYLGDVKHLNINAQGIQIEAAFPKLNLDAWLGLTEMTSSSSNNWPLKTLKLTTDHLVFKNRLFNQVGLSITALPNKTWHLQTVSDNANGWVNVKCNPDQTLNRLEGHFDRLYLNDEDTDEIEQVLSKDNTHLDKLPNIALNIDDLRWNNRRIGSAHLEASLSAKEWTIDDLQITNAGAHLRVTGAWTFDQVNQTKLLLHAKIVDMGQVLDSLQYANALKGAPGELNATLRWNGGPSDGKLSTLSGQLKGDFAQGEFLQIEPGAGRILGLLSMQHLLRRLVFDFHDVFWQGFGFDSLHVEGKFNNGVFSSPRITVLGSAASVVTEGKLDMNTETLNFHTVILPSINAGGPSLALALVNPAIGIGTFVTQWVLKDQLSELFKTEYRITGSIDNPKIEKLSSSFKAHPTPSSATEN